MSQKRLNLVTLGIIVSLFIDPAVKENKLKFWTLDAQEQPQILARLLRLQMVQSQAAVVSRLSRMD